MRLVVSLIKGRRDPSTVVFTIGTVAVVCILVLLAVVKIFSYAAMGEGPSVLVSLIASKSGTRLVARTLLLGVIVGAISTLLGVILAYAQVRTNIRYKRALHLLSLLPIVSPPFAVASSVIVLFGRNGLISNTVFGFTPDLYGLPGLIIVMSLTFFPISYVNMKGVLETFDPRLDEAASSLGASQSRILRTVTISAMLPAAGNAFLLIFIEAIADLANPLVIGGDYNVLASRAYFSMIGNYDLNTASAYSVALILPALTVFVLQRYWVGRRVVGSDDGKPAEKKIIVTDRRIVLPVKVAVGVIIGFVLLIYSTILWGGFIRIIGVDNSLTLDNFALVLSGHGYTAFVYTTLLALIAAPIATLIGVTTAWLVVHRLNRGSSMIDFVGMLGIAVPGTVLGIGYATAFSRPTTIFGFEVLPALTGGHSAFAGSIGIAMVFIASTAPIAQRIAISSANQIDRSLDNASSSLGASGFRTYLTVYFPLMLQAYKSGLISVFAKCMTLMSAVVFITTPTVRIVAQEILTEVDAGRFGNVFAYCAVLVVFVVVWLMIFEALFGFVARRSRRQGIPVQLDTTIDAKV